MGELNSACIDLRAINTRKNMWGALSAGAEKRFGIVLNWYFKIPFDAVEPSCFRS